MNKELSQERLKELLEYDEDTGIFIWKVSRSGNIKSGTVAGSKLQGYSIIMIDRINYKAHRLAWLYVHGYFPENFIDHKNGIRYDNRISNLREVSKSCNGQNCKIHSNNKSGYNGVSWEKTKKKWRSQIKINTKHIFLGLYDCKLDAGLARITAEDWDDRWTCDSQCISRTKVMQDLNDYINEYRANKPSNK